MSVYLFTALLIVGSSLLLIFLVRVLHRAFKADVFWGAGIILFPLLALLFIAIYHKDTKLELMFLIGGSLSIAVIFLF